MSQEAPLSFESAYARLEEILEKMNSGKVSLEESLKLYEEADGLIAWSSKKLVDAEKKIEMLVKNREGELLLDAEGRPQVQEFSASISAPLQRKI
jgi:exodeoxyribonuclease VII small subunit